MVIEVTIYLELLLMKYDYLQMFQKGVQQSRLGLCGLIWQKLELNFVELMAFVICIFFKQHRIKQMYLYQAKFYERFE